MCCALLVYCMYSSSVWNFISQETITTVIHLFGVISTQAGLQPRDSVEVLYEVQEVGGEGGGASLMRVVQEHKAYIESTTKGPVNRRTLDSDLTHMLVEDKQKV